MWLNRRAQKCREPDQVSGSYTETKIRSSWALATVGLVHLN